MKPTLVEVKTALNIDYSDHDDFLLTLTEANIRKAELMTGRNYTKEDKDDFECMSDDIKSAIIRGVATDFVNRDNLGADGASETSTNADIYIYRMNSKRPML